MNPGIYPLGGQIVTPVQGPFSGVADARKLLPVQVLVVAGGGPGGVSGTRAAGGGGGGGVIEQTLGVTLQTSYTVTVGAAGSFSQFGLTTAVPGGSGLNGGGVASGASSGGIVQPAANRVPSICSPQGNAGGVALNQFVQCGGGGGAGAQGGDAPNSTQSGAGGAGRISSITGTATAYAGGGGGGGRAAATTVLPGAGGSGGGGAGSNGSTPATSGTANTGGGGGGGATEFPGTRGIGGSGIVIFRWDASQAVATLSAGLTFARNTVGTDTVITITAGTGTVTFS